MEGHGEDTKKKKRSFDWCTSSLLTANMQTVMATTNAVIRRNEGICRLLSGDCSSVYNVLVSCSLTLAAHARSKGYCSCSCLSVSLSVCLSIDNTYSVTRVYIIYGLSVESHLTSGGSVRVLKILSRTQRGTEVKTFVGGSLKP